MKLHGGSSVESPARAWRKNDPSQHEMSGRYFKVHVFQLEPLSQQKQQLAGLTQGNHIVGRSQLLVADKFGGYKGNEV